jgi:oligopeptide transport system substrate-binding protein
MFRLPAITFSILAVALVCGCDSNPHPKPLRETRADGSPWQVRYGVLPEDPRSFDPQFAYDQMSRRVMEPVYDTLLEYHPIKTEPYEVMPGMLAEMPTKEVSADGKISYLCRLKEGIRYHDDPCFPGGKGREVVAEDVHYAWQRICDPKVESPFVAPIGEAVVGMLERNSEAQAAAKAAEKAGGAIPTYDYSVKLSGVEVLDRYRFRIHLKRPFPQLVYWLAMHATTPVAREAVETYDGQVHDGQVRDDFRKFKEVGTGPYRIAEYIPRQRVRLERVEGYKTVAFPTDGFPPDKAEWLKELAGKPLPFIDEVSFSIMRENIPIFVLTRQGYLDGMSANKDSFAALLTAERDLAPKYKARGMFLERDAEPSTFWIAFNMENPVIGKNRKLRQALACAYDPKTYSEIFYNGVAPVATQLIPPGIFGFEKERKSKYSFNVERGRQLIAEAGYPNGRDAQGRQLELTIDAVSSGSEDRQRSEYDQRYFEALGIKVKVSESTFARLMDKQDEGSFQISTSSGWGADYPDPENYFFLFYSKNFPPAGKNYVRYNNPEFDKLYEEMAVMENTPERMAIIRRMNDIIAEDVPIIPTFNKQFYTVVQPWARRTHNNLMLEGGIKYLTLDPVLRDRLRSEWNRKPLWPIGLGGALLLVGIAYAVQVNRRRNA